MVKHLLKIILAAAMLFFAHSGWAYDFSAISNGTTFYYNITSNTAPYTVAVTYRNSSYNSYSGNVTIPSTVTNGGRTYSVTGVGNSAFYGCSGLTSITIPNSVTSIGNYTFNRCTGLTSVIIPDSVTSIGDGAFNNCTGLTSVTIGNSVKIIGADAFEKNTNLTSVIIPDSVTSIGNGAFIRCFGLTSVTIGNSVKIIGANAFQDDTNLISVIIPDSVTSIGNAAFAKCTGLTSVTIGNSVTSIGISAFYFCSRLTSVSIPNSVTSIGMDAFFRCTGLTSITIPNSVTSIGKHAFCGCTGLTSVTIGNSVTSIGWDAFGGCTGLTTVNFNADSCIFMGGIDSNNHVAPVFLGDFNLTTLNIGNNVKIIPDAAFCYAGLTSVTIPDAVKYIGRSAFESDTNLTTVTIGRSVDSIGGSAFYGCSRLTSVTIPNSVTSIGGWAFGTCTGLTTVNFNADSCIFMGGIDSNNHVAPVFLGDFNLTTLNIGNNVKIIPDAAFVYTCSLTSVTIPDAVKYIGRSAFESDTNLTTVTIGRSVDSIGVDAFYGCTGLNSVTMRGSSTTIGNNAFYGVSTNIPVYVPCGALAWYRNQLSGFSNIIETLQYEYRLSSHDNVKGTVATVTAPTCNSSSWTICATPNYGYTFSHWSDGDTMNPRNITLTKDTNIIAFFSTIYYNVALSANDTNIGSVSGSGRFAYLSQDTLTATANTGYVFTRWNDGNTQNPRVITVVQDTIFTAYFAVEHNVIVHSNDSTKGSVSGSGRFANLSQDTLTATAETGYTFTRWNDGNKQNPRVITVTQDTIFTAFFAVAHNVVVHSDDSTKGSVSGSGIFGYLTQDTLTATANTGYAFSHWNDGNTSNPRIITVTQDTAFTAFFSPNYYNVTVLPNDTAMGTVSGSGRFAYLSWDTLTATPNIGYSFVRWSDGYRNNPRPIFVTQDTTFTAFFSANYYNVTVSSNDTAMGTVTGNGRFAYLSQDTITATANTGYTFSRWSDGNTQNPRSITVTQDTILIAFFTSTQGIAEAEDVSITIYPNPASETVTIEGVGNETNIFIINSMGKVVRRLENAGGTITFSVGDLPKGIYFVRVGNAVRKLVVD